MTNQIAFVHIGSFSHANQQLAQALRQQFPTYTLDMIDMRTLIMRQKAFCLRNLRFLVQEYGKELLLGRRSFRRSFFATTYMFRQMSALAAQQIAKGKYHFSLQTQSMFDASTPEIDHFVYTDHTVLAHFQYLGFNRRDLAPYLFTPQWIALEKQVYHHATLNFAMSNFVVESIIEDYGCPAHKVVQAYAGGNAALATPSATKRYDQKNILFVGMDWERKGGPVLAAAFQQLLATHPDATLTIVGCSPKLTLPNCRVTGRIPLSEVQQHYDAATVFCLPTKLEPFGFVFIEAMGQKLPIVATRVGAIPDFVQDGKNGYLVDPDDVTGLANALKTITADPERCRLMGEAGRRTVDQCYSWETVARIMKEHIVGER
jgi:glycosyltransferase involved in cell wall biosynthesis